MARDQYCDRYFVYTMCAQDIDKDGHVDFMYFDDSKEIFMQSTELAELAMTTPPKDINMGAASSLHRCVQTMDKALELAASALLSIDENTGALTKTKIKTRLMLSYGRYMGEINRCHNTEEGENDTLDGELTLEGEAIAGAGVDSEIIDGQEFGDYDFADF